MIKKKLKMLFFEAENAKNIYLLTLGQKIVKKTTYFLHAPKRLEDECACLEILKCMDFWKN